METIGNYVQQNFWWLLIVVGSGILLCYFVYAIITHTRKPSQEKFGKQIVKRIRKIGTPYSWSMSSSPSHAIEEGPSEEPLTNEILFEQRIELIKRNDELLQQIHDCEQVLKLAEMHLEEELEKRRFDVEKHSMLFAVKTNKQVETALLHHIKEHIRVDGNVAYIYIATPKK